MIYWCSKEINNIIEWLAKSDYVRCLERSLYYFVPNHIIRSKAFFKIISSKSGKLGAIWLNGQFLWTVRNVYYNSWKFQSSITMARGTRFHWLKRISNNKVWASSNRPRINTDCVAGLIGRWVTRGRRHHGVISSTELDTIINKSGARAQGIAMFGKPSQFRRIVGVHCCPQKCSDGLELNQSGSSQRLLNQQRHSISTCELETMP